jgi:hypothetical protein
VKNKPYETKQPAPQSIVCRDCGCGHFYTLYTRHKPGYILRMKQCRYCGRRIHTREVANGHGCAARTNRVT